MYTYLYILTSSCMVGFFHFFCSHIQQEGFGSALSFPAGELLKIKRVVTLSSSKSRWRRCRGEDVGQGGDLERFHQIRRRTQLLGAIRSYLGMRGQCGHQDQALLYCCSVSNVENVVLPPASFSLAAEQDPQGEPGPGDRL